MNHARPHKAGLALGAFFAIMHALWALMVLFGFAQWFLNFIFALHFITPPYTVAAFSWWTALMLVIVTAIIGYIFGWLLGWVWNRIHRSAHE